MKNITLSLALFSVLAAGAGACADDLEAEGGGPQQTGGGTNVSESGVRSTFVNSSNMTAWIYFSFASGATVEVADARSSKAWDIAFQRYKVISNGGESGSGGVSVAGAGNDFAAVTRAPAGPYLTDVERDANMDNFPDYAFLVAGGGWFKYDMATHAVNVQPVVFAVKAVDGNHYKVQLDSYYDAARSPAQINFRWAKIEAPQ